MALSSSTASGPLSTSSTMALSTSPVMTATHSTGDHIYKGKHTNRSWQQLPPELIRYVRVMTWHIRLFLIKRAGTSFIKGILPLCTSRMSLHTYTVQLLGKLEKFGPPEWSMLRYARPLNLRS
jgi:hypothetical protein